MFVAHHAIGTGDDWSPARLTQADRFWAAFEELQRGVYGTGPLRHVIGPSYLSLPWYPSWLNHQKISATQPDGIKPAGSRASQADALAP